MPVSDCILGRGPVWRGHSTSRETARGDSGRGDSGRGDAGRGDSGRGDSGLSDASGRAELASGASGALSSTRGASGALGSMRGASGALGLEGGSEPGPDSGGLLDGTTSGNTGADSSRTSMVGSPGGGFDD